ncbi:MAG: ketopantoate reductase family protein [Candidatus Thorarchaeota archaeon]
MTDRVYILGAGAIGLALAVNLNLESREVILVRTSRADVSKRSSIISMTNADDELVQMQMDMVSLDKLRHLDGIVVNTAKSYANEMIANKLARMRIESPIVVMQNGMGVERPFLDAGFAEIYRCILFSTSQKMDELHIRYRPIAPSPIGIIRGDVQTLHGIVNALNTSGFQFSAVEDIQEKIWQKTILNSVFNSICPLLDVDNGIFHRNDEIARIALEVMEECALVASAVGVKVDINQLKQQMLAISKAADGQFISTLQDIRNGRETEISSLNLAIARIADEQNPKIRIDKTRILGELTFLKSEISRVRNDVK